MSESHSTGDSKPDRIVGDDSKRLQSKIRTTMIEDTCWHYTGYIDQDGYGRIHWRGNNGYLAHRAAYELAYGEIEAGREIDHTCGVRHCVRYEHLDAVTREEHVRREVE